MNKRYLVLFWNMLTLRLGYQRRRADCIPACCFAKKYQVPFVLLLLFLLVACQQRSCRSPAKMSSLEEGKYLYEMHCASCHGEKGNGQGPVAKYLWPKPRDFTSGVFKFRRGRGTVPSDLDLMQTMYLGVPGTSMPGWYLLSKEDWQSLLDTIKTFSPRLRTERAGPEVDIPEEPKATPELIQAGKQLYEKSGCVVCHGAQGAGDGLGSYVLKDVWGDRIAPRDLTLGPLKWGNTPRDIYRTLMIGVPGTPMPAFEHTYTPHQMWTLVHYLKSIQKPLPAGYDPSNPQRNLLVAKKITGEIPLNSEDAIWRETKEIPVFLKPLWAERGMTEWLGVKAIQNEKEIAFYLRWFDDQMDTEGAKQDAIAIQFPMDKITDPLQLPYLGMGSESKKVNIWEWKGGSFTDWNAAGISKLTAQESSAQNVTGRSHYAQGEWHVIMKRALSSDRMDAPLLPEGYLTFALWDADLPAHKGPEAFTEWIRYELGP